MNMSTTSELSLRASPGQDGEHRAAASRPPAPAPAPTVQPAAQASMDRKDSAVPVLDCRSIERRFGGLVVLKGVNLRIDRGEIFGLVGPNGSGKTTMTNAITGFFPPQAGSVWLNGRDITGLAPDKVATQGLARTFQNLALFNGMSVLDNILLGRHIFMKPGVLRTALYWWASRKEEMEHCRKVEEIIDYMHLQSVRDELVDSLPIGLKKRVELARALAAEPSLLILDEPMAGMNQEEKEYMARFILDARDERGATVLLIEHHMDVIVGICDRMTVLSQGEVIDTGVPAQVIANPKVIDAYLGRAHAAH